MLKESRPSGALRGALILLGLLIVVFQFPTDASAQTRPRIFFDCDGRDCNSQHYRTEIDWVDWVNDREVADVHLIVSSLSMGAGGREYQLDFIGREAQEAYADEMRYQSFSTDTDIERLDGLTEAISVGLLRFSTAAGFRGLVTISGASEDGLMIPDRVVGADEVEDPWDLWVFRINEFHLNF